MKLEDINYRISGQRENINFRIDYFFNQKPISPWNDIPLKYDELYTMVVEIPTFTQDKIEMSKEHLQNSLMYDLKDGQPRKYYGPIYWNYGFIPQTWEDPQHFQFNCGGDDDPLDIIEIGHSVLEQGSVHRVKVLGSLGMIDQGEFDWKIIAINKNDQYFNVIDDIHQIDTYYPHTLNGIKEWFRWYKYPDKKKLNLFELDEEFQDRKFSVKIIEETHRQWINRNN